MLYHVIRRPPHNSTTTATTNRTSSSKPPSSSKLMPRYHYSRVAPTSSHTPSPDSFLPRHPLTSTATTTTTSNATTPLPYASFKSTFIPLVATNRTNSSHKRETIPIPITREEPTSTNQESALRTVPITFVSGNANNSKPQFTSESNASIEKSERILLCLVKKVFYVRVPNIFNIRRRIRRTRVSPRTERPFLVFLRFLAVWVWRRRSSPSRMKAPSFLHLQRLVPFRFVFLNRQCWTIILVLQVQFFVQYRSQMFLNIHYNDRKPICPSQPKRIRLRRSRQRVNVGPIWWREKRSKALYDFNNNNKRRPMIPRSIWPIIITSPWDHRRPCHVVSSSTWKIINRCR